ncbi:MAG: Uma2 family endonuclease [Phormidesmis sp.]
MVRTLTRWTVEDYHCMIANGVLAGRQVELIDGQIIDMAPELPIHRATYRRGVKYLAAVLKERAVVFSAAPIILPSDGEPQPDICIAAPPESQYDLRHPGPEDIYWLIEISNSTLSYDLGEKSKVYAQAGIKDYWVADVQRKQLWVHREPKEGKYHSLNQFSSGSISPLLLPDVTILVERLFL